MIWIMPVAAFWVLWVMYLAVMNLDRARKAGTLHRVAYWLGMTVLAPGLLLDWMVNIFLMTIIMLELPRELTVTARLKRHIKGSGYRRRIAHWLAVVLLDPFDPAGKHV